MRLAAVAAVVALSGLVSTCRLQDLVQPGRIGALQLSSNEVVDSARAGSTAPRVAKVVLGVDGATLRWSVDAANASAWLHPEATTGVAPDTLSVSLDPGGLAAGVYRDTLVFSSSIPVSAPVHVPVEFRVTGCPVAHLGLDTLVTDSLTTSDCGAPNHSGSFAKLYRFTSRPADSLSLWLSPSAFGGSRNKCV